MDFLFVLELLEDGHSTYMSFLKLGFHKNITGMLKKMNLL